MSDSIGDRFHQLIEQREREYGTTAEASCLAVVVAVRDIRAEVGDDAFDAWQQSVIDSVPPMRAATHDAWADLDRIVHTPSSPERLQAMASAMADTGELGRLTRVYLLTVADLAHGGAQ